MIKNRLKGDIWRIKDNDRESQNYGTIFKYNFSFIASEEINDLVMDYVWNNYRTGNKTAGTLFARLKQFITFNAFAEKRNIKRLGDLTNNDVDNFQSYLRTAISDNTKKPFAYRTQKAKLDALKSIINWGKIHKQDAVPDKEIFTGNEYTGTNRHLVIDFIPDDTLAVTNESLKTEENRYVRYGIVILESTGMRIGDLLLLPADCIKPHPIDGHTIQWFNHKKRKDKKPMPVMRECVRAVEKLLEYTRELRDQADENNKKYLLIHKQQNLGDNAGQIVPIIQRTFFGWLKNFIQKNKIVGTDGKLYNLKTHQFRRTLGTDMLSKGTNINVIQQVLDHAVPATTKRFYADVKDRERVEIFRGVGIIGNINKLGASAFDNKKEMEWFKSNKDRGACMSDGYCTKPIEAGNVCDRLLKRQKCYSCIRYITTPDFLEAHKMHLNSLERQITENSMYGDHYVMHFRPTIEVLKVIIERLEEIQDGRKDD